MNLFCPALPHTHTHLSTFTDAGNIVGWVEEGGSPSSPPHTHTLPTQLQQNSHNKLYRIQNREYRIHKLMYIKLPITCFLYGLDLMISMQENPLLWPLEGVSPENLVFLGPNGTQFANCNFRAQKSLDS